jgi:hypothetical protein
MDYNLIQTITGIIGLISVFLLLWQIKSELKWKKLGFSIDKIDISLLIDNKKIISDAGIDMENIAMSDEDYKKLTDEQNITLLYKARDILDMFEVFAVLYNMNALNKSFSYESYSENVIFYYLKLRRIIDFYRNKYDQFYYNNLEICANEFIKRRDDEQKTYKKGLIKLKELKLKIRHKPIIFKEKF